jgi:predicted phosphodiesterase
MSNKTIKDTLKIITSSLKEYVDNQLSRYAKSSDIPTRTTQLINDSGYIKSVPSEYVTEDELTAKDYATTSDIPTKVSELTNDKKYLTSVPSSYATTSYVDNQIKASVNGTAGVPNYVITEAQDIAEKVIETRNAYSLVIGAMSDLHTTGIDSSATGVLHAWQGMNEIDKLTPIDLATICGDVVVVKMDDTYKDGLRYVRSCFNEVTKNMPLIHMQGNHDELSSDSTEEGRQKYFRYIGANNQDTVTDFSNRYRNYGYKDFDDLRFRVIYLNSADCSDGDVTADCHITSAQYKWFINKALDFSSKEEPNDWHFIVMNHHPLNWNAYMTNLQSILKAHKKRTSGSFTVNGETISYNFTNATQNFVCHIHGHLHNFRTDWYDDVLSLTIPNACLGRNNEYGTYSGNSDQTKLNFGDIDENGNQRQFNKTSNTAEDTAFVTLVIDSRVNNMIYAYCYGAGIHREIDLVSKEVTYISKEVIDVPDDTPDDEPTPQGNLLPKAIDTDGSIYNRVGYKSGWRLSGTSGLEKETENFVLTGYIPFTCGDVIRMANISVTSTEFYVWTYDGEFNPVSIVDSSKLPLAVGDTSATWDGINSQALYANAKYIRISIKGTMSSNTIITINEEITDDMLSGGGDTPTVPFLPSYATNLNVPTLTTDTNPTPTSQGWIKNARINSSNVITTADGYYISNIIDIDRGGTLYINGMDLLKGYSRVYWYHNGAYITSSTTTNWSSSTQFTNSTATSTGGTISTDEIFNLVQAHLGSSATIGEVSVRFGGVLTSTIEDVVIYTEYNLVPTSTTLDGTDIYNTTGYKDGCYVSSSDGGDSIDSACTVTGLFDYPTTSKTAPIIYVYGATIDTTNAHIRIGYFKADNTFIGVSTATGMSSVYTLETLGDKYYKLVPVMYSETQTGVYHHYGEVAKLRMSFLGSGDDLVVWQI